MRKAANGYIFILFLMFPFLPVVASETEMGRCLMIINSEDEEVMKKLDVWEHNILDPEQSIRVKAAERDAQEVVESEVVRLDFDVNSSNPAMVGLWVELENRDLFGYEFLHINLRSEEGSPFSGNIALQFKDENNRKSSYLISGISENWKEHKIPLRRFSKIADWSKVKEFEIIIDDINARPKEGVLFIDKIYVSSSKRSEVYEC